jgi:hypothetical protein
VNSLIKAERAAMLRPDLEFAEKFVVRLSQAIVTAASALSLKMRLLIAERDKSLPVVSFAHGDTPLTIQMKACLKNVNEVKAAVSCSA